MSLENSENGDKKETLKQYSNKAWSYALCPCGRLVGITIPIVKAPSGRTIIKIKRIK